MHRPEALEPGLRIRKHVIDCNGRRGRRLDQRLSSAHGNFKAWLDGYGTTHTDTLSQTVTIPAGCTRTTVSFWLHIDTAETTTTTQFDKLTVTANSTTLATFSNLNHNTGYAQHTYSLGSFAGKAVTIKFTGTEDSSLQTSFVVDDTAVSTS